jgi:RNase H-fold protein (predicted Holliday junction resolvase)
MDELIIAIDPGSEKCGVAVVHKIQGVHYHQVVATGELNQVIAQLIHKYKTDHIVLGDRTSSKSARRVLSELKVNGKAVNITLVNEHHSTEEARGRYWRDNPPHGLRRLLPVTMQVPPVPVDDYVAVILAERFFTQGRQK